LLPLEKPIAPEIDDARLRELRHELGLTQAALASVLGVGEITLAKWEQGRSGPEGLLLDFYRALDCLERRRGGDGCRELLQIAARNGRTAFIITLFSSLQGGACFT